MIKTKNQMYTVIGAFILVMLLTTVTYAFFNYTRTGVANNIRTGRIYFNSTQNGTLNLTNLFPVASNEVGNSNQIQVRVYGDTTYTGGEEFEISLVSVNNTITSGSTEKEIPINYIATYAATPVATGETPNNIGTSSNDYFNARGNSTAVYKLNATGVVSEGEQVLVGYIPANAGVDGTLTIKAYLDASSIAISDTYDETSPETEINGTTTNWVNGRTVLTTTEWNSLANTPISFKIKAEANEGIWVEGPISRNDMMNINSYIDSNSPITSAIKSNLTQINFVKMNEATINMHDNLMDLTASNGEGVVKAWVEDTTLYIASPGETYFPANSYSLLAGFSNVTQITFNNINTSEVTDMTYMFGGCSKITNLDLSSFSTTLVETMQGMFNSCYLLETLDLSGFDTSSLTNTYAMFSSLTNLTTIYVSNNWDVSNVSNSSGMFSECNSLVGGNGTKLSDFQLDDSRVDKTHAVIDTIGIPGYLTLKSN